MSNTTYPHHQTIDRVAQLRSILKSQDIVRTLEAHNGLTGMIVESTKITTANGYKEFNAIWEGSLTDATSKGKPDISVVDMTSRIQTIQEILDVTTKPMIVDANNGGLSEIFGYNVRTLERIGVSAVCIEDKVDGKRNSLYGTEVVQAQDTIENFCRKISHGKASQQGKDFMIIARIESLILKQGIDDALKRAEAYIQAGADSILIHSKEKTPDEILTFCKEFKKLPQQVPLIAVPTIYNSITEQELHEAGVKVVIYANHLLRSAYPAMKSTAESILANGRSMEADTLCMPIREALNLVPTPEVN